MPRSMKIKVDRTALLRRVVDKRLAVVKAHEKKLAEYAKATGVYDREMSSYVRAIALALTGAAKEALAGTSPKLDRIWLNNSSQTLCLVVKAPPGHPKKPADPGKLDTVRLDRHISMLEMCSDDTISVGTDDDFGVYL